jgi:hypothetical protein
MKKIKPTIKARKKLRHDSSLHLSLCCMSIWCKGIYFIQEQDTGGIFCRLVKEITNPFF